MKVLFDHQAFFYNNYGGVARYFCELINQACGSGDIDPKVIAGFGENVHIREVVGKRQYSVFGGRFPGRQRVYRALNQSIARRTLRKGSYDLFHCTYYDNYYGRDDVKAPIITTVHDLSYEDYEDMPEREKIIANRSVNLRLADRIICVSRATQTRLFSLYPWVQPERVSVIHHGWRQWEIPKGTNERADCGILYVGNRAVAYKNFVKYIDAMAIIAKKVSNAAFVCAGGGEFTEKEKVTFSRCGLIGKMRYVPVKSDADLARAYCDASVFVYPSKCEGFGMPVLEAFSSGCPVILADAGALPEVGGDAAVYFDADSAEDLASKVIRLVTQAREREMLVARGVRKLSSFSWEKALRETAEVYRDALANYRR